MAPTLTDRSIEIINKLKAVYDGNRFQFDFFVAQYLSGDNNKAMRQEVVLQVTGNKLPASKCGMYATADLLRNSFNQYQLF